MVLMLKNQTVSAPYYDGKRLRRCRLEEKDHCMFGDDRLYDSDILWYTSNGGGI